MGLLYEDMQFTLALTMTDLTRLPTVAYKPRIFILTDILNEPDDSQSLVRYLLYSNEFYTRGICATTSTWLRYKTHPEEIRRILTAYGKVVDNLNHHVHPSSQFRSAHELLPLVTSGPRVYGKRAFNEPLSNGSKLLLEALTESDEPLYIPVWGGTNTIAQALKHLSETTTPEESARQRSKIRIYAVSDQDNTGAWIRAKYPDVFYTCSIHGWNEYAQGVWMGMHTGTGTGPDHSKVRNPWLNEHIRIGELGGAYPEVKFGMEGDTPSFLWLIQNGLGHRDHPDWGGWGGRYTRIQSTADEEADNDGNHYCNTTEYGVVGADGCIYSDHRASVWRWRDAVQDDFAARMQWTLTSDFASVAHPPVISINGHKGSDPLIIKAGPGDAHVLDASDTCDPDSLTSNTTNLEYNWFLYGAVNFFQFARALSPESHIEALDEEEHVQAKLPNNLAGLQVPEAVGPHPVWLRTPDFHIVLQVTNLRGNTYSRTTLLLKQ
ncbi:hypothetical protein BJY04DRAFT_230180 [Aspergillus karnatakaensis]|uniref:DUF1593 domain-containing protein n=1 Tax=Aspergillus karnatakaensis TaxID=1810916 RepID=UPI003CCD7ABD